MRLILLILLTSNISWANPFLGIISEEYSYGSRRPNKIFSCWDESGKIDLALCDVEKSHFKCNLEVKLFRYSGDSSKSPMRSSNHLNFILDYENNFLGFKDFHKEKDLFSIIGFNKISKVLLQENNDDISPLLSLKSGQFQIKDSVKLHSRLVGFEGNMTLIFVGLCSRYVSKLAIKQIPLFDQPVKGAKELGKIIVYDDFNKPLRFYHSDRFQNFVPNISSSWGILHQANDKVGDYLDMGKGPWGVKGWALLPYVSMFSGNPIFFEGEGNSFIEYFKDERGVFFKRIVNQDDYDRRYELFSGSLSPANLAELQGDDGLIRKKIKEVSLNSRNDDISPELIDFTNSEILLNGAPHKRLINVYAGALDSAPLLGVIEISFEKNSLTAEFVSTDLKKTPFISDYFFGRCDKDLRFLALNNVFEKKLFFSQIGPGPWGIKGWVKETRQAINSAHFPIKFSHHGQEIKEMKFNAKLDNVELKFSKMSQNDKSSEILDFKSILKEGKLLLNHTCQKTAALPVEAFELYYTNLLTQQVSIAELTHKCRNEDFPTLRPYCKVEESDCEAIYYNEKAFNKGVFTFSFNRNAIGLILQLNEEVFQSYSSESNTHLEVKDIIYPTRLNAFAVRSYPLNGLLPGRVHPRQYRPEISSFQAVFNKDKDEIKFDFPSIFINVPLKFSGFDKERELTLLVGNYPVQSFSSRNQAMGLGLTEGSYPLSFTYQQEGEIYHYNKTLVVKNGHDEALKISFEEFTPKARRYVLSSLSKEDKNLNYDFNHITHFSLKDVSYVNGHVKENFTKDVIPRIDFAQFRNPLTRSKVQDLLALTPYSFLKVKGLCQISSFATNIFHIDVFSSPSPQAKKIGFIKIENNSLVHFVDLKKVATKVSTLMNERCKGEDQLIVGVRYQDGSRVGLGLGPWGDSAWINGQSYSLVEKLLYNLPGFGSVSLTDIGKESVSFLTEGHDVEVQTAPLYEVFTGEGKFKHSFTCGY